MRTIRMVKKVLADGEPCRKCVRAEEMLRSRGVWDRIDEVLVFRDAEPDSEGARLARAHGVALAPFFVVRDGDEERVYQSTLELIGAMTRANSPLGGPIDDDLSSEEAIARAAAALSVRTPEEVLGWAVERFSPRLVVAFSGAEDVVLIHMAHRAKLPIRVFCLDTGRLHPQTYHFIDRVRAHYGLELSVVSPSAPVLEAFVRRKGLFSFYDDGHAECCSVRKLEPLQRALHPFDVWVTGQRRDQSPTRSDVCVLEADRITSGDARGRRLKLNPLWQWSSARVWQYIRDNGVPYNDLHDQGYVSIGCEPCTRPLRPGEHERAARWWWEEGTQRECGLHARA